jgi:hypothetical protein
MTELQVLEHLLGIVKDRLGQGRRQ